MTRLSKDVSCIPENESRLPEWNGIARLFDFLLQFFLLIHCTLSKMSSVSESLSMCKVPARSYEPSLTVTYNRQVISIHSVKTGVYTHLYYLLMQQRP